jgi:magnesium transporter
MTLVDAAVYKEGRRILSGTAAEVLHEAKAFGGMAWVGLYRPDADEMHEIAQALDLHPLAVEDALIGHQRAKLERYGEMTFLVLQPARYMDDTETVEFGEVHVFVGPGYVITVRHAENPNLAAVRHRLESRPDVLAIGPYAVVWAVCDDIIDQYLPVVQGVENDIDEIEDELFSGDPTVSKRIFGLQREVIDLQHATTPLLSMLDRLQKIVMAVSPRRRRSVTSTTTHASWWSRSTRSGQRWTARSPSTRRWSIRRTTRRCAAWPSPACSRTSR